MPSHCWRCHCLCRRHYRHDATSVVATARHGFAPSLLLIVVCYLLLSASAVAIVVTNTTSASASAIIAASSASTVSASLAVTFRPGGASRGRGQRTPWSSPVRERGKKGIFKSTIYLTKSLL
jgi:hypothetical protein